MNIPTILDHIDGGRMALLQFQHGFIWNQDQVRGPRDSFYRRRPAGSLLTWVMAPAGADHRGGGAASEHGMRYFTFTESFRQSILEQVLAASP